MASINFRHLFWRIESRPRASATVQLLPRTSLAAQSHCVLHCNWGWLLSRFTEWDAPEIVQCVLCFQEKNISFSSRINFNAFAVCKNFTNFCCFNFIKSSNQTRVLLWICNSDVRDLDVCDGFIVPANREHAGFLYSWKICVFCVSQVERRRGDIKLSDLVSLYTDFVFYRCVSLH